MVQVYLQAEYAGDWSGKITLKIVHILGKSIVFTHIHDWFWLFVDEIGGPILLMLDMER